MDMTRKLILAAWALLLAAAVPAQQKEEFRLWPEAGKYAPERLGAGFDRDNAPYVTLYRPEGKKPAPAVVVCPGGAYGGLAIGHEGYQVAEWFAARGFAAVVLKYTMPHGNYDLPRRDVQQAIELVRANAAGWGVDPARVGVIGFSAGGHLASTAALHLRCEPSRFRRPGLPGHYDGRTFYACRVAEEPAGRSAGRRVGCGVQQRTVRDQRDTADVHRLQRR